MDQEGEDHQGSQIASLKQLLCFLSPAGGNKQSFSRDKTGLSLH